MKKLILLILFLSCNEKEEKSLSGKIITRNDSIIVAGEDTLTLKERLKYNTYMLHIGDTIK